MEQYCQSCAMPMIESENLYGTNGDGSKNKEYCIYCFKDGKFTSDGTLEEMIEAWIPHMVSEYPDITQEKARKMMQDTLPTLKRWKK